MKLTLFINKTVDENASYYFEIAKKAKRKLKGARKTLEEFESKHDKTFDENVSYKSSIKTISRDKKFWFEKFKWFISSDGYLVVGGRDATTNEILIKKHLVEGDVVFHTELPSSPFVIIKKDSAKEVSKLVGKSFSYMDNIPETTISESANFTFVHSRARKRGFASASVFWVNSDQVIKSIGGYSSKGSFIIRGKKNILDASFSFACGIIDEKYVSEAGRFFLSGPVSAVKALCSTMVEVEGGNKKTSLVAKEINSVFKKKEEVSFDLDTIIASLPSGGCQIKFIRKTKEEVELRKKGKGK